MLRSQFIGGLIKFGNKLAPRHYHEQHTRLNPAFRFENPPIEIKKQDYILFLGSPAQEREANASSVVKRSLPVIIPLSVE